MKNKTFDMLFYYNMKNKTKYSITIVTGLLLVYVIATNLPIAFGIVFLLFLLTTAGLLWMVYAILTDTSNLSGKTFDEYFYEDVDHRNME